MDMIHDMSFTPLFSPVDATLRSVLFVIKMKRTKSSRIFSLLLCDVVFP